MRGAAFRNLLYLKQWLSSFIITHIVPLGVAQMTRNVER